MIERSRWVPVRVVIVFLSLWVVQSRCSASASAPIKTQVPVLLTLDTSAGDKVLAGGIQVYSRKAIIQVEALRDDVVRIRIARDGVLPEDASWAVLPSAPRERGNRISGTRGAAAGFRTG